MKKWLTKKTKIILCMLSAIIFALLIWTIWGNTALTVSNIKISSSRIPAAFSGFRIAQISDLHNNNAYGKDEFMRLYSRILAQMDYGSLGE